MQQPKTPARTLPVENSALGKKHNSLLSKLRFADLRIWTAFEDLERLAHLAPPARNRLKRGVLCGLVPRHLFRHLVLQFGQHRDSNGKLLLRCHRITN